MTFFLLVISARVPNDLFRISIGYPRVENQTGNRTRKLWVRNHLQIRIRKTRNLWISDPKSPHCHSCPLPAPSIACPSLLPVWRHHDCIVHRRFLILNTAELDIDHVLFNPLLGKHTGRPNLTLVLRWILRSPLQLAKVSAQARPLRHRAPLEACRSPRSLQTSIDLTRVTLHESRMG
jgi:hypothetical protein